ncbi:hypothetical protein KAU32_06695 [bacterium]|nr:hypothetical protein [bacterium]
MKENCISSNRLPGQNENDFGTYMEGDLHRQLKAWISMPGDRMEASYTPYIIDIVRDDLFIEVQTGSFHTCRKKFETLCQKAKLTVVYPLVLKTYIKYSDKKARLSPRRRSIFHIFNELSSIGNLLSTPGFSFEVLECSVTEHRDRNRSRKGYRITGRTLLEVLGKRRFVCPGDYFKLFSPSLPKQFTNGDLVKIYGIRRHLVSALTLTFRRAGMIRLAGKRGRFHLYEY